MRGHVPGWPTTARPTSVPTRWPAPTRRPTSAGSPVPWPPRAWPGTRSSSTTRSHPFGPARNGAGGSGSSAAPVSTPRASPPTGGRRGWPPSATSRAIGAAAATLGVAALGAAVRARDGRGPRTLLERTVPAHFELRRPIDVTMAIEYGRIPATRLEGSRPIVFEAARRRRRGRPIHPRPAGRRARDDGPVDHPPASPDARGTRSSCWPAACSGRRMRPSRHALRPASTPRSLWPGSTALDAPPVLGAALLGLDRLGGPSPTSRREALARARATLVANAIVPVQGDVPGT